MSQTATKKILVPLDGSELAEEALDAALDLAAQSGGELHLVAAVSSIPPVSLALASSTKIEDWLRDQELAAGTYLAGIAEQASSRSPGVAVETHVSVGDVSGTVSELADELDVDLLVMTTHGRGAFKRSWLGSVADQLLRRVTRPLLVLPHREKGLWTFDLDSLRHVLIPLDGSDAAEKALDALPLVLPRDETVRVTLACVIEDLTDDTSPGSPADEYRGVVESYLKGVADRMDIAGVGAVESVVLVDDNPGNALLQFCDDVGVHLVAMSTHGRGGASRLLLGSVADKLIRGAPVPVLVTKRPEEEADSA